MRGGNSHDDERERAAQPRKSVRDVSLLHITGIIPALR